MKEEYKGGYVAVKKADGQNLHYSQDSGDIILQAGDKMYPGGHSYKTLEGVNIGCEKPYVKPGVYRYKMQKERMEGKSTISVEKLRDL